MSNRGLALGHDEQEELWGFCPNFVDCCWHCDSGVGHGHVVASSEPRLEALTKDTTSGATLHFDIFRETVADLNATLVPHC